MELYVREGVQDIAAREGGHSRHDIHIKLKSYKLELLGELVT